MTQLLAMARKEFILWAQKTGSWIVVFVVPLLFIWIMQAVFGASGVPVVTIFLVNEDESLASERVVQALTDAENLRVIPLETRSEADRRIGAGERMAAVVVPEGFGSGLTSTYGSKIDIIIDPARSEQANIVVGLVNAALSPLIVDAEVTRGVEASIDQIFGGVVPSIYETIEPTAEITPETTQESEPLVTVISSTDEAPISGYPAAPTTDFPADSTQQASPNTEGNDTDSNSPNDTLRAFFVAAIRGVVSSQVQEAIDHPQVQLAMRPLEGDQAVRKPSILDYLVPGYSLMFMFFLVPSLAITVVEERQTGTLRRLLTAPLPRSRILLGKMLPFFLIAFVQMTFVFSLSVLVFDFDLSSAPKSALFVMIICSSLALASLGILIAAVAQTEGQADGLATIIVLAMAVISGAMFPSISIPGLQMATPHYWAMQGFLNIITRGQGMDGVLLPAGILLLMALFFFTAGAVRFRFE
jgi:ABC-2 type transport system permease protein